jgi:hypothetical protein
MAENITQEINDTMKELFIETYRLYELEKQFNYDNYGRYPYRDRKKSVQIFADFSTMSYSVSGLFVTESEYEKVYPPVIITRLELVLVQVNKYIVITRDSSGNEIVLESGNEIYELQAVTEFVPIEDTTVQTIQYLFPFNAAQNINSTVLSF